jgi:hypothetical protein
VKKRDAIARRDEGGKVTVGILHRWQADAAIAAPVFTIVAVPAEEVSRVTVPVNVMSPVIPAAWACW